MDEQGEVKKRKACNACTKAKAKCSPFGDRTDLCQRCERLNKECVYQDSLRRRGPRQRGRMKQLEQRVESLMSILAVTRGEDPGEGSTLPHDESTMAASVPANPSTTEPSSSSSRDPTRDVIETPPDSPESYEASAPYDPIAFGLISEHQANVSLNWFREAFVPQFPFVLIDPSLDANALRQQQPFLFLSIMAVTASSNPMTQRLLGEAFRDEVAACVIVNNHKGIEILQGLLIHVAYYNHFYMPGKQQMGIMLQLCIAVLQDLGDPKTFKTENGSQKAKVSMTEKRARLGTYFVAAWYSQAFRKRTTLPYSRSLARFRQAFVEHPECPSDSLIPSLIDVTELMCQITEFFSYDEIEDSEMKGDAALELAVNNFRRELKRLRDTMLENSKQNASIQLLCDFTEAWIYEGSLHAELWHGNERDRLAPISPTRARMLQRSFSAAQTFIRNLLAQPAPLLHVYAFTILSGWLYTTIAIVKLIFLHANGGSGALSLENVPHKLSALLPKKTGDRGAPDIYHLTTVLSESSIRDADMAARESEILPLFQALVDRFTSLSAPSVGEDNSLLMRCCSLQKAVLGGLKNRMDGRSPPPPNVINRMVPPDNEYASGSLMTPTYPPILQQMDVDPSHLYDFSQAPMATLNQPHDHQQITNPNPIYFDNTGLPGFPQVELSPLDTWMWDLVTEDVNMFTM